jgi:hypothetical protein
MRCHLSSAFLNLPPKIPFLLVTAAALNSSPQASKRLRAKQKLLDGQTSLPLFLLLDSDLQEIQSFEILKTKVIR